MKQDQIVFQAKASAEGRSRVFLRSREEVDGGSSLASVVAKDFRLGAEGEGLTDALFKLDDLDKRAERTFTILGKEAKAAHRRMDNHFPTFESRMSVLEDKLSNMVLALDTFKRDISSITDDVAKMGQRITQLGYEIDHLTDSAGLCEEAQKDSQDYIVEVRDGLSTIRKEVEDLKRFNEKVVLFYSEDDTEPSAI